MIEWVKFKETYIPVPILTLSIIAKSYIDEFTKQHDGKTTVNNYRQALGYRWYGKDDLKNYKRMFLNSSFKQIMVFTKRYKKHFLKSEKNAKKISIIDWNKKSDQDIIESFKNWVEISLKAYNFCYDYIILNMILPGDINTIILDNLEDKSKFNYYLEHILGMDKPADIHLEQKSLGELALYVKKNGFTKKFNKMMEKHLEKFAYLKMFTFVGNPYHEEEIIEKIKVLVKKNDKDIIKETIAQYNQLKKNKEVTEEFIKDLSQEEKERILILKEYLYISIWGDQNYHKGPFLVRNLLKEICRRKNLAYNQLIQLTTDEVIFVMQSNITPEFIEEINKRAKENAFVYSNCEIDVFTGEKMKNYLAKEIEEEEKLKDLNEVTGETAHPGIVRGKVRILQDIDKISEFQEGEILFAADTNPAHVPAMKKAAAIVTNEGGMLSHAAIVSREMRKPCVIGTKYGTKVFKTGEDVEVDANKGVVRRVK
ncbi:MAG: PEP-utilizing enzyme [Candidatus Woesearchaeota archaeon]